MFVCKLVHFKITEILYFTTYIVIELLIEIRKTTIFAFKDIHNKTPIFNVCLRPSVCSYAKLNKSAKHSQEKYAGTAKNLFECILCHKHNS